MKKVTVKIPAKINLSLDVVGKTEKFHNLKSIVASINLYDVITVKRRKDSVITLTEKGILSGCSVVDNNAYKTAIEYKNAFNTLGFDIILNKNIPVGNGLGGSSADIAGVLQALYLLDEGKNDVEKLAESLGSDSAYMLKGGVALIEGRGEKVTPLKVKEKFYLVILPSDKMVSAKESYKVYDSLEINPESTTDKAVKLLLDGEREEFLSTIKNDLYLSSKRVENIVTRNLNLLRLTNCERALMSGSGTATYGIYRDEATRDKAYVALKKINKTAIKANTL